VKDPLVETLERIDQKLSALLAITVDQHLRATDIAKPRPRTIDRLLDDVGLSGAEIGRLLGKSPQAVSQALARDGKAARNGPKMTKRPTGDGDGEAGV
jgi:DNA-binding transcriptional ArsR family regulator